MTLVRVDCSEQPNSIKLGNKRAAWCYKDLLQVMEYVKANEWIILGGDILTLCGKHTYDNWFYNPNPLFSLRENSCKSTSVCLEYASKYVERNGFDFIFELVISEISACS